MTSLDSASRLIATALDLQSLPGPDDGMDTLPAWSSLGHVRIVMEMETILGRVLTAEEIVSRYSVRSVAQILSDHEG